MNAPSTRFFRNLLPGAAPTWAIAIAAIMLAPIPMPGKAEASSVNLPALLTPDSHGQLPEFWTREPDQLAQEDWNAMVEVFESDEESRQLLEQATHRLQLDSPEEIFTDLRLSEFFPSRTVGEYHPIVQHRLFPLGPVRFQGEPEFDLQRELAPRFDRILDHRVARGRSFLSLTVVRSPVIVLRTELDPIEAYATLVHELTHFVGDDFFDRADVLAAPSINERIEQALFEPGGEWEAFRAEAKALIRLRNRGVDLEHREEKLLSFFDREGELADARGLMQHLLHDRRYAERLRDRFTMEVLSQLHDERAERRFHERNREATLKLALRLPPEELAERLDEIDRWIARHDARLADLEHRYADLLAEVRRRPPNPQEGF